MNLRSNLIVKSLFALAVAGCVVVVAVRQSAIASLRAENQTLLAKSQEAQKLAEENQQLPELRVESEEVKKLRQENEDLPRLRNEARQLRRAAQELDGLRAENQRLLAQNQNAANNAGSSALPPNFIPRTALYDAGLATPEATVQTYFWAMSQGNFERLIQCYANGAIVLGQDRAWQARQLTDQMSHFTGFAIVEKNQIMQDVMEVGLQSSANGPVMKMNVRQVGNEWKLEQ
jgi:hypothetical protein